MGAMMLLIAVLIPFAGGFVLFGAKNWSYQKLQIFSEGLVVLTSILIWFLIFHRPEEEFFVYLS